MRRLPLRIEEVAAWNQLLRATRLAARGKRHRGEVARFLGRLDRELGEIRERLLDGTYRFGLLRSFWIQDPKRRKIEAPPFRDRVVHHALVRHLEPWLERTWIEDSYACRRGKGCHAAVRRAAELGGKTPWTAQFDVRRFFASVDHGILLNDLSRRIRGPRLIGLVERLLSAYAGVEGNGLPIGALTSQLFANHYLAPLDRILTESAGALGYVRYMDDLLVFCRNREQAVRVCEAADAYAARRLHLELHPPRRQRTSSGWTFLGFRMRRRGRRVETTLTLRRRRRYSAARRRWEQAYRAEEVGALELQRGYDCALAITSHARSRGFRLAELARRSAPEA